jgi:hypothetical protein
VPRPITWPGHSTTAERVGDCRVREFRARAGFRRRRKLITERVSQRRKRNVAMPRSFNAFAILAFDVMPSRSSAAIVSAMDRAKASARA